MSATLKQFLVDLDTALADELPAAFALRRRIHAEPAIGGEEARTSTMLAEELGCPDAPRIAGGCLIRVETGEGAAVALRAELDGLPIEESSGVPWAATNGAMHACGHDVHLAALSAVVRVVRRIGGPRPLLAVLQPREETFPSGAVDVLASPLFAEHNVGAFIAAHLQPTMPSGVVAAQGGPVNAAADDFRIVISGNPGHGAYPHHTNDPVVAAAAVVTSLQTIVARRMDPMHPTVISVGSISAGFAANAIPAEGILLGTIRSYYALDRIRLHDELRRTTELIAQAHGCAATVDIRVGDPILENDGTLADRIAPLLANLGLSPTGDHRSCGADDFSYYCERYPSLMCFVGADAPPGVGLHHTAFVPADQAVVDVAHTLLAGYLAACEFLSPFSTEVSA